MKYILMVLALIPNAPVLADETLCDLQVEGRLSTYLAEEGNAKVERIDIPNGYSGLRFEARFNAFRAYDYYVPNFQVRFKSPENVNLNLMFRMRRGDEAIVATTEILGVDGGTAEANGPTLKGFDYRGRARQPFRADVLWTGQGQYTIRIYTTDKGFAGPFVSQVRTAVAPAQVYLITQAAKIEMSSLRFAKVCASAS